MNYGPTLCSRCSTELILNVNWSKHRKNQRSHICKKCEAIRARTYVTKRRERRARWLNKIKQKLGCNICGYNEHPAALQFDHIHPDQKLFGIGSCKSTNLKTLFIELRKCRVLCANCHAIHTFKEGHHARNKKY